MSRKASYAIARSKPQFAMILLGCSPHWAGAPVAGLPHRSLAAMATANFSLRRSVVDRLVIDRLGQHGDGITDGAEGPIYVPGTLCRAKLSKWTPCPATLTAVVSSMYSNRARSELNRSAGISEFAAAA